MVYAWVCTQDADRRLLRILLVERAKCVLSHSGEAAACLAADVLNILQDLYLLISQFNLQQAEQKKRDESIQADFGKYLQDFRKKMLSKSSHDPKEEEKFEISVPVRSAAVSVGNMNIITEIS